MTEAQPGSVIPDEVAQFNSLAGQWWDRKGPMRALHAMSADLSHTTRFDRGMRRLRAAMLVCLCIFGIWASVQLSHGQAADASQNVLPIVIPASAAQAGR